jgi:glycosyltransferase involved in cell wall biosynthesis
MTTDTVILDNYIRPGYISTHKSLEKRLGGLRILISTPMEPNKPWPVEWGGLAVEVQRTLTFTVPWKHPQGFTEPRFIHVPIDALWRLWRLRPSVVISTEMGARTIQAAIYRLIRPDSRLIIQVSLSEHTEKGRSRALEWLRRRLLRRADAVLVRGESGCRYIRRLGVSGNKVFIYLTATDWPFFDAVTVTEGSKEIRRLLYVGRLVELKGLLPFLRILSRWAEEHPGRGIEMWFAGDGPLRPALESMETDSLSLRFLGHVSYEQLPEIYASADLLVLPTLSDEWGLVVNEALGVGVPVLGSLYSQAVNDLVEDGMNGWTFYPDRPEDVYSVLDHAMQTPPDALRRMREAAVSKMLDLTPDKVADRFLEAISFVLRSKS